MIHTVYLITGSNRGNRFRHLLNASTLISQRCGTIIESSRIYNSQPWGFTDRISFLNQVHHLQTLLEPLALLASLKEIEALLGRKRSSNGYTARTIDIDILFYDTDIFNSPELTIPHQRLHERRFVLEPMAELAPHFQHPLLGKSISQLLELCTDKSWVIPLKTSNHSVACHDIYNNQV